MEQKDIYLSVIVPAYNEAERIEKTLLEISDYLSREPYTSEILVVSGASTDETGARVSQLSQRIKNLRLLDLKKTGKGYVVRKGMLAAYGRIRLFTDADNSTDISHFEKMRPLFDKGYDVVICSRNEKDAPGAQQAVSQKGYKRLLGTAGNLFIQFLAVPGIWDTQCGFKAFRAKAAEKIYSQTKINHWGFDIEVLALARAMKMRVGIVPAYWVDDPRSHVKLSGYIRTLWETVKVWWWLRRGKYQL